MTRKIKLIAACLATVVASLIIISALLVFLGLEDKIELFFQLHLSVGAVVIFILFWPFYSKRLK